jgi:hypothetical protein
MSAEVDFSDLMERAEAAAWRSSNSFTSKLQTSVKFTARKQIRKAPTTAIKFVLGKVPFVGSLLSFGAEKISAKIRKKRITAGLFKHAVQPDSPVAAKYNAKSLSEIATKIDSNVTKQEAAYRDLEAAMTKLRTASFGAGTITALDWLAAFKNAAYAYYRVDHYNVKLADLVEVAQLRLENIEKWTEKGTDSLVEGKNELWQVFEERYGHLTDDNVPLLGVGRPRSSSSSSLSF